VFPLPAPLKVAVFPLPGTGDALQFDVVAQTPSVEPVQLALAAEAVGADATQTAKAAARRERVKARKWGPMVFIFYFGDEGAFVEKFHVELRVL